MDEGVAGDQQQVQPQAAALEAVALVGNASGFGPVLEVGQDQRSAVGREAGEQGERDVVRQDGRAAVEALHEQDPVYEREGVGSLRQHGGAEQQLLTLDGEEVDAACGEGAGEQRQE